MYLKHTHTIRGLQSKQNAYPSGHTIVPRVKRKEGTVRKTIIIINKKKRMW